MADATETPDAASASPTVSPPAPTPTPESTPAQTPYEAQDFDAARAGWRELLTEENRAALAEMLPAYVEEENFYVLLSMTSEELESMEEEVTALARQALETGISNDNVDTVKRDIVNVATDELRLGADQREFLLLVVNNDVYPNEVLDERATQAAKDQAAAVEPMMIQKGQNIVLKGNPVTAEQYEMLRELGLLSGETTFTRPYYALTLYIALCFVLYILFLAIFNRKLLSDRKKVAILCILTALAYVTTALAQMLALHLYPIFLFVILGAVLLSPKNALIYSVFLSLLLMSVTTNGHELLSHDSLWLLLTMLMGSFFGIYVLKDMRYRSRLILAGLIAAVPGVVIEHLLWVYDIVNMQQMFTNMAMVAGSGLLCGIASIGVLPIIENAFKLTTPTKLLELSDPNHPLTKRLMVEAPGTYHHSMLVANLAEAACNAVGGFSLLARVGAYFHDVGKLANPQYFKENQRNNVNPHDGLSPGESSRILRQHVTDGVEMMKKHKMPKELITITAEHHGNSLTGYFYAQAKNDGGEVDVRDFRYDGIPPTTKEGAIIMLADIVEAAVRSLDNPGREEIEGTVKRLIRERYDEGQLDNAPLNRSDLNKIAEAFTNLFAGVYHSRIKYPEIKIHGASDDDNIL
ncbi:MAG TPA: hypothetical protein DEB31_02805 [Clostridiales bacterium]|nr:hypothetical protein [Clostridiales bacterium]